MHYKILHCTTNPATRTRTVISVAGYNGHRLYQRQRYQLAVDQPLLTDDTPCTERIWSLDGQHWDIPTEEEALAASTAMPGAEP